MRPSDCVGIGAATECRRTKREKPIAPRLSASPGPLTALASLPALATVAPVAAYVWPSGSAAMDEAGRPSMAFVVKLTFVSSTKLDAGASPLPVPAAVPVVQVGEKTSVGAKFLSTEANVAASCTRRSRRAMR